MKSERYLRLEQENQVKNPGVWAFNNTMSKTSADTQISRIILDLDDIIDYYRLYRYNIDYYSRL